MRLYSREDGAVCKALKFEGDMENRFEVMDLLIKANLLPMWYAEVESDEWVENEEGTDFIHPVIPEHITTQASDEEVKVGDYVVVRDEDTYIMDGQMFEAIWSDVFGETPALGESARVKIADICKNCGKAIANFDTDGNFHDELRHSEGVNNGSVECSIFDTEGEEGYVAERRPGNTPKEITND